MFTQILKISIISIFISSLLFISCSKDNESINVEEIQNLVSNDLEIITTDASLGKGGCYELVYPISIAFSNDSTLELNDSEELRKAISEWYKENGSKEGKPSLIYPYTVTNKEGEQIIVTSDDKQKELRKNCKGDERDDKEEDDWRNDKDEEDRGNEKETCFTLNYPLTYIYSDGHRESYDDKKAFLEAIKLYFESNGKEAKRPVLQYPISITLEDGSEVSVDSDKELLSLKKECLGEGEDKDACFSLVYPVSFSYPDGTVTEYDNKESMWKGMKEYYEDQGSEAQKPQLVYPITILYGERREIEVESNEALQRIRLSCKDKGNSHDDHEGDDDKECFELVFPLSFTFSDKVFNNEEEMWTALKNYFEEFGDRASEPQFNFPLTIIFGDRGEIVVDNQEMLERIEQVCSDRNEDNSDDNVNEQCFIIQFPLSYVYPDGTIKTFNERSEVSEAIEAFFREYGRETGLPELQYPIEVILSDRSSLKIENEEQLERLRKSCD